MLASKFRCGGGRHRFRGRRLSRSGASRGGRSSNVRKCDTEPKRACPRVSSLGAYIHSSVANNNLSSGGGHATQRSAPHSPKAQQRDSEQSTTHKYRSRRTWDRNPYIAALRTAICAATAGRCARAVGEPIRVLASSLWRPPLPPTRAATDTLACLPGPHIVTKLTRRARAHSHLHAPSRIVQARNPEVGARARKTPPPPRARAPQQSSGYARRARDATSQR